MRWLVASVMALLVAACASERAQIATVAQARMIGLTKAQLLACAGAPYAAAIDGDTEILSFEAPDGGEAAGHPTPLASTRPTNLGQTSAATFPLGRLRQKHCIARVVLVGDHVRRVSYVGSAGTPLTDIERCASVVEPCAR